MINVEIYNRNIDRINSLSLRLIHSKSIENMITDY